MWRSQRFCSQKGAAFHDSNGFVTAIDEKKIHAQGKIGRKDRRYRGPKCRSGTADERGYLRQRRSSKKKRRRRRGSPALWPKPVPITELSGGN